MGVKIRIDIDDESLSQGVVEKFLSIPSRLHHIENRLDLLVGQGEKIMAEIDDLNAKLDAQGQAITDFNTTLQTATGAIATEIQQLADAVQSATDLATLKTQVSAAAARVESNNTAISQAGATLQAQVDALASDDPTPPSS